MDTFPSCCLSSEPREKEAREWKAIWREHLVDTQKPYLGQTWGGKSVFWKKIGGCYSLDLCLRGSPSSSSRVEKEELPAGRLLGDGATLDPERLPPTALKHSGPMLLMTMFGREMWLHLFKFYPSFEVQSRPTSS